MITFLASEAMLFGGLIGGYIVLRLARGERAGVGISPLYVQRPEAELKYEQSGGVSPVTSKSVAELPLPPPVATAQRPSQAPPGTTASMRVSETTVKFAELEQIETAVASVKLRPWRTTVVPAGPLAGAIESTAGGRWQSAARLIA